MSSSPQRIRTSRGRVGWAARSVRHGARAFGFWIAVLLPAIYPAVLIADAWLPESRQLLLGVLGVHLMALVLGRGYERRSADQRRPSEE
jgi:hypothetical protein